MDKNDMDNGINKSSKNLFLTNTIKIVKHRNFILIAFSIAAFVCLGLLVEGFATAGNIVKVLNQISAIAILAIGVTFCIITGGTDLSIHTNMALSAVIGMDVMVKTGSVFLGIVVILAVSLFIGLFNGFAIAKLKMVPMVVTLATMTLTEGLATWYSNSLTIPVPEAFLRMINATIGPVPIAIIIMLVFAIIMNIVLKKTILGRWIYAVGTNYQTARVCGMPVNRAVWSAYIISGLCAGVAALLLSARLGAVGAFIGPPPMLLEYIAAGVLGGASLSGGKGTAVGAIFGALVIGSLSNAMNLGRVDYYITLIIKGSIIIFITFLDVQRNKPKKIKHVSENKLNKANA